MKLSLEIKTTFWLLKEVKFLSNRKIILSFRNFAKFSVILSQKRLSNLDIKNADLTFI